MTDYSGDKRISQKAATMFEVLIYAQHAVVKHSRGCSVEGGCEVCRRVYFKWKKAKMEYLDAVREMIG